MANARDPTLRTAQDLTILQRQHLKAIAAHQKNYPFNAIILELLVERALIAVRDDEWYVTLTGQSVLESISPNRE